MKSPAATEEVKESVLAPDTGQPQADLPGEPQAAAAASTFSPATSNNNSNNYNLVTSLLNLTKSPVSDLRLEIRAQFICFISN